MYKGWSKGWRREIKRPMFRGELWLRFHGPSVRRKESLKRNSWANLLEGLGNFGACMNAGGCSMGPLGPLEILCPMFRRARAKARARVLLVDEGPTLTKVSPKPLDVPGPKINL